MTYHHQNRCDPYARHEPPMHHKASTQASAQRLSLCIMHQHNHQYRYASCTSNFTMHYAPAIPASALPSLSLLSACISTTIIMTMTMHSDYHYVAYTVPHVLYSEYDAICPICPICLTRASMPYMPHMTEYSEYRTLYSQDAYPLALCLELAAKASGSLW